MTKPKDRYWYRALPDEKASKLVRLTPAVVSMLRTAAGCWNISVSAVIWGLAVRELERRHGVEFVLSVMEAVLSAAKKKGVKP